MIQEVGTWDSNPKVHISNIHCLKELKNMRKGKYEIIILKNKRVYVKSCEKFVFYIKIKIGNMLISYFLLDVGICDNSYNEIICI